MNENDSEELESGCETDDNNGTNRKKYLLFKLHKDMVNYKMGVRNIFCYQM